MGLPWGGGAWTGSCVRVGSERRASGLGRGGVGGLARPRQGAGGIACHVAGARKSPEPKGGGGGRSRWPARSASADAESRRKSPPRRGGSSGARQMAAGAGSPAAVSNPPAYCFRSSLAGGHMADGDRGRGGRQGAQPLASEGRPALHPGPKLIPTDPSSSLSSDQACSFIYANARRRNNRNPAQVVTTDVSMTGTVWWHHPGRMPGHESSLVRQQLC